MAFSDPQKVKVNGVEVTLPRVGSGNYSSEYASEDGQNILKISTQNGKRKRQVIRLDLSKLTDDPFSDTTNMQVSASVYLVVDRPLAGFTNEEMKKTVEGFFENLTASTGANLKKFLASEN